MVMWEYFFQRQFLGVHSYSQNHIKSTYISNGDLNSIGEDWQLLVLYVSKTTADVTENPKTDWTTEVKIHAWMKVTFGFFLPNLKCYWPKIKKATSLHRES